MKHFKIYLAGPIGGLSYEEATNGWRKQIEEYFPTPSIKDPLYYTYDLYSPMRYKDVLKGELSLDDRNYTAPQVTPEAITARDRYDVQTCDLMVVNFLDSRKVSIGTCVEFGWADAFRKPIVVITDSNSLHNHPILNSLTPFVVDSLEQAAETAIALLRP